MTYYSNQDNDLFPTSGIYGITYDKEIIYIGQAKNIEERLEQHFNTNAAIRTILAR